jgi:hypothetical protein
MQALVAGATAVLLTLVDLDKTFYVPRRTSRKVVLYSWWWLFVLANGGLAIAFYGLVVSLAALETMNPSISGSTRLRRQRVFKRPWR